jgi:hypothetical protein
MSLPSLHRLVPHNLENAKEPIGVIVDDADMPEDVALLILANMVDPYAAYVAFETNVSFSVEAATKDLKAKLKTGEVTRLEETKILVAVAKAQRALWNRAWILFGFQFDCAMRPVRASENFELKRAPPPGPWYLEYKEVGSPGLFKAHLENQFADFLKCWPEMVEDEGIPLDLGDVDSILAHAIIRPDKIMNGEISSLDTLLWSALECNNDSVIARLILNRLAGDVGASIRHLSVSDTPFDSKSSGSEYDLKAATQQRPRGLFWALAPERPRGLIEIFDDLESIYDPPSLTHFFQSKAEANILLSQYYNPPTPTDVARGSSRGALKGTGRTGLPVLAHIATPVQQGVLRNLKALSLRKCQLANAHIEFLDQSDTPGGGFSKLTLLDLTDNPEVSTANKTDPLIVWLSSAGKLQSLEAFVMNVHDYGQPDEHILTAQYTLKPDREFYFTPNGHLTADNIDAVFGTVTVDEADEADDDE